MSGVDTVRGVGYQNGQAILRILDVIEDSDLDAVRVEAANDVIDVEVLDVRGNLVVGAQYKTRQQTDTWGKEALLSELRRWEEIGNTNPQATYRFETDGRLGPSGKTVAEALDAARLGSYEAIAALLGRPVHDSLEVFARATILSQSGECSALLGQAEARLRILLPNVASETEASERATQVIERILRLITERGGKTNPDERMIKRSELADILNANLDHLSTKSWNEDLRNQYLLTVGRVSERVDIGVENISFDLNPSLGRQPVETVEMLHSRVPVILFGASGSGKSSLLEVLCREGSKQGKLVLIAKAEDFVPGRLGALAAKAMNSVGDFRAFPATGTSALRDPAVILAIDGISEVPHEQQEAIRRELTEFLRLESRSGVILSGRDGLIAGSILPPKSARSVYSPRKLDRAARLKIAEQVETECNDPSQLKYLVALVEKSIGDGASTPVLFTMAFRLICAGLEIETPARMYQQYFEWNARETSQGEIDIPEAGLGFVFASLINSGRHYCDRFEWSELLAAAVEELSARHVPASVESLNSFAFESGIVVRNSFDANVRAFHDSMADYLAAVAHRRGLVEWPDRLQSLDSRRLQFFAEMVPISNAFGLKITRDIPYDAVALSEYAEAKFDAESPDQIDEMLQNLFSSRLAARHCWIWKDPGERHIISFGDIGGRSGWLETEKGLELKFEYPTFVADGGPLRVAVRIWRAAIKDTFAAVMDTSKIPDEPSSLEEARQKVDDYVRSLHDILQNLVLEVAPEGHSDELRSAIGSEWLNVQILNDPRPPRECPAQFKSSVEYAPVQLVDEFDDGWSGSALVESFLDRPSRESVRLMEDALNNLTVYKWL